MTAFILYWMGVGGLLANVVNGVNFRKLRHHIYSTLLIAIAFLLLLIQSINDDEKSKTIKPRICEKSKEINKESCTRIQASVKKGGIKSPYRKFRLWVYSNGCTHND